MKSEYARGQQPTRDVDVGKRLVRPQRSTDRPGHDPERGLLHEPGPTELLLARIGRSGARHDQFPQPRVIRRVDLGPNDLGRRDHRMGKMLVPQQVTAGRHHQHRNIGDTVTGGRRGPEASHLLIENRREYVVFGRVIAIQRP